MINKKQSGCLYVVATPIGNADDITLHAIKILNDVDAVICEELKEGSKLLHSLDIIKPLIVMNEHNESEVIETLIIEIMAGKRFALVSDCGTPLFADPGKKLVSNLTDMGLKVIPIPGTSSLMAALSVCAFPMDHFVFSGFLPPKNDQRKMRLNKLKYADSPVVLMDTPYRMGRLLDEIIEFFGKNQQIFLGMDLTQPKETILHGPVVDIAKKVKGQKREFILILDAPQRRDQKNG